MNILKKAYCRLYQAAFRLVMPFLPYREPEHLSSVEAVATSLFALGVRRVLLVTTKGMRSRGTTAPLEQALEEKGVAVAVYDGTCPNPTVENVEEALAVYHKHSCQGIIAFGGGSPMDCAKGVGARVARPNKSMAQLAGLLKVRRKMPPFVAIPTTAGSGSEVTLAAVITDSETKHKYAMSDFSLIPHFAVLDARVTLSLPPHLTATTGMDALTHAVEAYIGRSTSRFAGKMAKEAAKTVFANIEQAYTHPTDLHAREQMLLASYQAGVAFSRAYVGYVHAMAHALGGEYNISHGLANAVLLPHVLEAYGKSAEKKLHRLAVAVGVADENDTPKAGAEKFISAIKEMNKRLQIPATLEGIEKADVPKLSAHAEKEANPLYPVPKLMTKEELAKLYLNIMK